MTAEEADKAREESRLEAYQATCHAQGVKLLEIQSLLLAESNEASNGKDVSLLNLSRVTFKNPILRAIADIVERKGSNR